MKSFEENNNIYFKLLNDRVKKSRVYFPHQDTGLILAELLQDKDHVSLYMKLAKKHGDAKLIMLAKTVLEKKEVRNPAAYFMKVLTEDSKKKT